jgi:hypothetical protein
MLSVRTIVPVNPPSEVTVMVVRVDWPTLTALGEVAEIAKSWRGTVTR